jgi:hypothetical protein
MAKSKAEIQQEYNEALKVSQSLTGALNKMIDNTEKSQKKVSDAQKEFNNRLKSINSGATDYESTQDAILALEKQKAGLSKRYFGANAKLLPQKQKEVQANIDILSSEAERVKLVNELDSNAQSLANSLNGSLDGLLSGLDEIPGIGKGLSKLASGPINNLKGAFSDSAKVFTTKFSSALSSGQSGMKAFASAGGASMSSLAGALMGPQAIIAGIVALLALGVIAMFRVEKAAKAFREETGLLNSQTQQMEQNINSVYMQTAGLGASMEDVAKAAADFTNEFGGIEQPMANTMKSMMVLNKNFGVSTQDAAKLNKSFQNMGGLSEEVAQSNLEGLTHLAAQAGVAPGKIMADIADSAEDANGFFRGNVQAMGAAAINAAKMGTSLKEAVKVSRGLLDYQNSIGGEMEASAILGTNLNFSQSRYLAAQGDVVGAQASMVEQLKNQVDLQNLSVFEQEALEKATGMTLGEMQNMARIQELGLSTEGERGKLLQKALKSGMDISNMSKQEIAAATDKLALDEQRQGRLESMGNKMSAFGSTILQAFLPIGEGLISIIEPIFSLIQFTTKFSISAIKLLGEQFKNIMNIVKGIFTLDLSLIGDSFMAVISAPINHLRDMFPKTMEYIGGLVTGIKDKFMKMIPKETLDKISGSFKSMKESWEKIKGSLAKSFEKIKTAFLPVKEAWTKIFGESKSTLFDTIGKVFGFVAGVVGNVIGKVFGVIASIVERVANVFGYVASVLSGDIGLGEALMGIGSEFIGLLMTGPTLLWDGFTSIFGGIGSWLKDKILSGLGSIGSYLFGDDEESSTETEIKTSSTPADQSDIMKVSSPIGETEMGTISQMAASGDIVGAANQLAGTDMSEVVNQLKALTTVTAANKDVYVSGKKVTDNVTRLQEKSNINQFGLMGA